MPSCHGLGESFVVAGEAWKRAAQAKLRQSPDGGHFACVCLTIASSMPWESSQLLCGPSGRTKCAQNLLPACQPHVVAAH
jgi:hypothetical protein